MVPVALSGVAKASVIGRSAGADACAGPALILRALQCSRRHLNTQLALMP